LASIRDNPDFRDASRIRNDITHNYLPGSVVSSWEINNSGDSYITSQQIVGNVNKLIKLFEEVLLELANLDSLKDTEQKL
jgi:hypothetical protein